jgi:hypothetical protein
MNECTHKKKSIQKFEGKSITPSVLYISQQKDVYNMLYYNITKRIVNANHKYICPQNNYPNPG